MSEHASKLSFAEFYRTVFLPEHRQPVNIALHIGGTIMSAALIPWSISVGWPWLIVSYPVVHALPGLLGHRMLERNAQVGDVRVTRKDFSPLWFIAGNHVLTYEVITRSFRKRR
jgi:hypothetical protein